MSQALTAIGVALENLAAAYPLQPALTFEGRTLTRAELESRTNRLARAYLAEGLRPDTMVTIALPNGIEFVEATVAVWKAGAIPQPVSHRMPPTEREHIIALAQPSLLIGIDDPSGGGVPALSPGFEPAPMMADGPLPPQLPCSLKAPASGGSTGRPKLIVAGEEASAEALQIYAAFARMQPDGVHLVTGPLHHNGPFIFAMAALATGCHVVVMPRFDAVESLRLIEQYRADWMYAVPTMMSRIWRLDPAERLGYDLTSLRVVFHTAAPCSAWLKQAWIDWLGPERILELYSGTEAQAVTLIDGTEWLSHQGSVGRPVVGEIEIRDATGTRLAPGQVGTVWMRRGPSRAATYHYVGSTARAGEDGWETLGDMGSLDAEGYLYLADRETDMLLVGGSNVYPAEVEAALAEHPAVVDSCVIGVAHTDLGQVPHALVHLSEDVSDDALRRHLAGRLSPYKHPRSFERVDRPLRDDAGKVRRSALADRPGRP
jgi:bile acid-coenzyme A ligase